MEKEKQSARKKKKEAKQSEMLCAGVAAMNEDLLQNVLSRLPALSFSYAACVCKSWNEVCNRILSRPKLLSAFSLNPDSHIATREVLDKVLSEPIQPHFAIANIGSGLDLQETLQSILEKVGPRVPIIVSRVLGIIGRDARTNGFKEVKWGDAYSGVEDEDLVPTNGANSGILLTVGFVPGLKVDVIPLPRARKEPQTKVVDKFMMDIRNYVASFSDDKAPVGIIMFADGGSDQKLTIEKLDYAMPAETVIVGNERGEFLYRSSRDLRNVSRGLKYGSDAVALVFARNRNKPRGIGEIQFHSVLSKGVSAVGPRYKAASVRVTESDYVTWLTARREGQQEILDGQQILADINNEFDDQIECPDLYIGVTKRRNYSTGSEKPRLMTSLEYHGVVGGDEDYLFADGVGIRTGDYFQFYKSDPTAASVSTSNATVDLRKLNLDWNSKNDLQRRGRADATDKEEAFGGLIFSCCGRGESFFGSFNVDSSPILENFPGMPVAGIFCCGEIGRSSTSLSLQGIQGEVSARCCLHVYSTVYLVMSYTPTAQEN